MGATFIVSLNAEAAIEISLGLHSRSDKIEFIVIEVVYLVS